MFIRALILTVIPLTLIGFNLGVAEAQDAPDWNLRTINFTSHGTGITSEYRDKVIPIEILHSRGAADGVGDVAFVCAYGSLNFRIQVEPGEIYQTIRSNLNDAYERKANPRRTFRPQVQIGDVTTKKLKWIEGKQDRVVMPLEYRSTAHLYNAVIKGEQVRFTRKKNTMILNLPEPNWDFKEFGESCLRKKRR